MQRTEQVEQIMLQVGEGKAIVAGAFSFCFGRGWKAHRDIGVARRAAERDARAYQRIHGGGLPSHGWRGALIKRRGEMA